MLGDSLRDAVNVCVRNLDDIQLAIALARIREGRDDGPVLTDLLRQKVLPMIFEKGYRWLGSWAFWMLKRRDLAVRIIAVSVAMFCLGDTEAQYVDSVSFAVLPDPLGRAIERPGRSCSLATQHAMRRRALRRRITRDPIRSTQEQIAPNPPWHVAHFRTQGI